VASTIHQSLGVGENNNEAGLMTSPDIWINQGHIQMAKGNYVAAARHYEQAQAGGVLRTTTRPTLS